MKVILRAAMLTMLLMVAAPAAHCQDDLEEMSLDEALDLVYDDFIREVAPSAIKPYAAMTIRGKNRFEAALVIDFIRRHNPDFDAEIAHEFINVGRKYGIRGDVAICQAIVETGWFRYGGGTAVNSDQHNYCGLGVTQKGKTGAGFATVNEGVTAHIQHLYAYCCKDALPKGEAQIDPRFRMVSRGCARRWHELNNRWAMNDRYSTAILSVYASLSEFADKHKK